MSHTYGYVKCKVVSEPALKASRHRNEIQYHLHVRLQVQAGGHFQTWDTAINVGTNDSDDLLRYRLIYDFRHTVIQQLKAAHDGFKDLTGTTQLPALDFLRTDLLANTGSWRESGIMDGSDLVEPVMSLKRLLHRAKAEHRDVYIFGRTYTTGGPGIHDIHMNQGSSGGFLNNGRDDHNDHNDIWQDGALLVDLGEPEWAAYFTAFEQQNVPTDRLGNPVADSYPIQDDDSGSQASG